MCLPILYKKLPREGKNITFVTPKFPKFNRQKLEVPKKFPAEVQHIEGHLTRGEFRSRTRPTSNAIMEARTINQ